MTEFQSFESTPQGPAASGTGTTTPPGERKQSTLALVSLILGILSFVILGFIGGIGAVITGHLALKEINESGGAIEGETLAKVGLGLGYANLVLSLCCCIAAAIWFFVLAGSSGVDELGRLLLSLM